MGQWVSHKNSSQEDVYGRFLYMLRFSGFSVKIFSFLNHLRNYPHNTIWWLPIYEHYKYKQILFYVNWIIPACGWVTWRISILEENVLNLCGKYVIIISALWAGPGVRPPHFEERWGHNLQSDVDGFCLIRCWLTNTGNGCRFSLFLLFWFPGS